MAAHFMCKTNSSHPLGMVGTSLMATQFMSKTNSSLLGMVGTSLMAPLVHPAKLHRFTFAPCVTTHSSVLFLIGTPKEAALLLFIYLFHV